MTIDMVKTMLPTIPQHFDQYMSKKHFVKNKFVFVLNNVLLVYVHVIWKMEETWK